MNLWQLSDEATEVATHQVEQILERYDWDPVAISLIDEDCRRFFAVAADNEGEVTRWIEAEISEDEWRALLHGRLSLRDVFCKDLVFVVDRRWDLSLVKAWTVIPASLQDAHLPAQDAFFEEGEFSEFLEGITSVD